MTASAAFPATRSGHNAFIVVYRGEVAAADTVLRSRRLAILANTRGSDGVALRVGPEGARAILAAGRSSGHPIVQHGPFVMTTQQEIFDAVEDLRAGRLA